MANLNIQDLLNKSTKRNFDLDLPIQEAVSSSDSLTETLVSSLLQASLVLHICHLRITSFAKHISLKEAYEKLNVSETTYLIWIRQYKSSLQ